MLHRAMMHRLKNRLAVGGMPTNTGMMGPGPQPNVGLPPFQQNPGSPIFGSQPPALGGMSGLFGKAGISGGMDTGVYRGPVGPAGAPAANANAAPQGGLAALMAQFGNRGPIPPPSAANQPPMSGAEMAGPQQGIGAANMQPPPGMAGMNPAGPPPPGPPMGANAAPAQAGPSALGQLTNMRPGMGGPMMRPQVTNPGPMPPSMPMMGPGGGQFRGGMRGMPMQGNRMIAARGGMVPPPGPSVPPGGYMPRPSALSSLIGHGMAAQHHGFGSPRKPRIPLPGTLRNINQMQNHAKIKLGSLGLG